MRVENLSNENIITPEERRRRKINEGLRLMNEEGIDVEKYRKYFPLLMENDAPIGNGLFGINALAEIKNLDLELVKIVLNKWKRINEIYQRIEIKKQTSETGKAVIVEMKPLIKEVVEILENWAQGKEISIENLRSLADKIEKHGKIYSSMDSYKAYRAVGIYEVDPDYLPKEIYLPIRAEEE